jgi:hypothetical protein
LQTFRRSMLLLSSGWYLRHRLSREFDFAHIEPPETYYTWRYIKSYRHRDIATCCKYRRTSHQDFQVLRFEVLTAMSSSETAVPICHTTRRHVQGVILSMSFILNIFPVRWIFNDKVCSRKAKFLRFCIM